VVGGREKKKKKKKEECVDKGRTSVIFLCAVCVVDPTATCLLTGQRERERERRKRRRSWSSRRRLEGR